MLQLLPVQMFSIAAMKEQTNPPKGCPPILHASRLRGGGHETVFSSKFLSSELGNDGPNDNVPEQASNQAAGQDTDANQGTANAGRMAEDSKSLDLEFTSSSAGQQYPRRAEQSQGRYGRPSRGRFSRGSRGNYRNFGENPEDGNSRTWTREMPEPLSHSRPTRFNSLDEDKMKRLERLMSEDLDAPRREDFGPGSRTFSAPLTGANAVDLDPNDQPKQRPDNLEPVFTRQDDAPNLPERRPSRESEGAARAGVHPSRLSAMAEEVYSSAPPPQPRRYLGGRGGGDRGRGGMRTGMLSEEAASTRAPAFGGRGGRPTLGFDTRNEREYQRGLFYDQWKVARDVDLDITQVLQRKKPAEKTSATTSVEDMGVDEVSSWMMSLELPVNAIEIVKKEGLNGKDVAALTVEEMETELGLSRLQAKKLMNRIQEFKKPAEVKEAASKSMELRGLQPLNARKDSNMDWNAVLDEKESATTYDSKTDAYEYEQASGTITEKEAKKLRKQIRDLKRQKKVSEGDTKQAIKLEIAKLEALLSQSESEKLNQYQNLTEDGGVRMRVISEGKGYQPEKWARVEVHFTGKVQGGEIFHNTRTGGYPVKFIVGAKQVIPGLDVGIKAMKAGGRADFIFSPEYGYGSKGRKPVDDEPEVLPGSWLEYNVELMAFEAKPLGFPLSSAADNRPSGQGAPDTQEDFPALPSRDRNQPTGVAGTSNTGKVMQGWANVVKNSAAKANETVVKEQVHKRSHSRTPASVYHGGGENHQTPLTPGKSPRKLQDLDMHAALLNMDSLSLDGTEATEEEIVDSDPELAALAAGRSTTTKFNLARAAGLTKPNEGGESDDS